jgi:hypothetical protein
MAIPTCMEKNKMPRSLADWALWAIVCGGFSVTVAALVVSGLLVASFLRELRRDRGISR